MISTTKLIDYDLPSLYLLELRSLLELEKHAIVVKDQLAITEYAQIKEFLADNLDKATTLSIASPFESIKLRQERTLVSIKLKNEINGILLNRLRENNHFLLQLLRGQENHPNLYNEKGSSTEHKSKPLAKA